MRTRSKTVSGIHLLARLRRRRLHQASLIQIDFSGDRTIARFFAGRVPRCRCTARGGAQPRLWNGPSGGSGAASRPTAAGRDGGIRAFPGQAARGNAGDRAGHAGGWFSRTSTHLARKRCSTAPAYPDGEITTPRAEGVLRIGFPLRSVRTTPRTRAPGPRAASELSSRTQPRAPEGAPAVYSRANARMHNPACQGPSAGRS